MSLELQAPLARDGMSILSGPEKVRSEHWWRVRLADGTACVLARLLPELAGDESMRRRYVRDAERRAALDVDGLARVIEIGPAPDPRDPNASPPWRLRVDPEGESLDAWLDRRAPAPVDEALDLLARLADVVTAVHASGAVLRDLEPRNVILGDGQIWLTDIGLARVDILSTRSASSLMLESSPYAAPEHLRATVIDHRADLYTLGAISWQALTGIVPFSDGPALFRERTALPPLADLGVTVPEGIDKLLGACLAEKPDDRPESARVVAETLRGAPYQSTALAIGVACQACGAPMRPGLRLCLACGKESIQFNHLAPLADAKRYRVTLTRATDDAEALGKLREFFEAVGEGPPPELNFLTGDARMYSKEERARLHKIPTILITDVSMPTADRLAERLAADGFKVRVEHVRAQPHKAHAGKLMGGGILAGVGGLALVGTGVVVPGAILAVGGLLALVAGAIRSARRRRPVTPPLAVLRSAPAALPASDPLVARLGALLSDGLAADVRERVSEMALLVQRLVDHRAANADTPGELAMVIEPVEPLVDLVCREVDAIGRCDEALRDLDEGQLVRALATSEARREPRSSRVPLLAGLDRLRELEDDRARHMQHLLEATSLIRRAAELGLSHHDDAREGERQIAMALAALGGTGGL